MVDNVAITAGTGTTVAADDVGGVLHQRIKLSLGADGSAADANSSSGQLLVSGSISVVSANFTRPADTAVYAIGDLVANSTTAASVVALSYATAARFSGGAAMIRRARLNKSGTGITSAIFRLHLYGSDPAASSGITNGDNGVWLTKVAGYLGHMDITVDKAFSDAAKAIGAPSIGAEITFIPSSGSTIYGLVEARAAYTPANAEVFTVELEIYQG